MLCDGNIHEQEIFTNLREFVKFTKISCTRKFAVLQYQPSSYKTIIVLLRLDCQQESGLGQTFLTLAVSPLGFQPLEINMVKWKMAKYFSTCGKRME